MNFERTNRRGLLTFSFGYDIEDVEDRPVPYSNSANMYRPVHLNFALEAPSSINGELPRYENLRVTSVTVSGPKLKKDGTPGNMTTRERIWDTAPDWAMVIIDYARAELLKDEEKAR